VAQSTPSSPPLQLATLGLSATLINENPKAFDHVKVWVRGPSDTRPDPPGLSDEQDFFRHELTDIGPYTVTTPGTYWTFARCYDVLGRASALIE
jgi:hypothetical protein